MADSGSLQDQIRFDERGLVPCIVQDWESGEVLTLAYMNADALARTLQTGETVFWSRSRRQLWHKGESSGNTQTVKALRYDCDADAILALVQPHGPACHTGARTCFHNELGADELGGAGGDAAAQDPGARAGLAPHEVLPDLERTIAARKLDDDGGASYTAALLRDPQLTAAKVREEAEEVTRAAREEPDEHVAAEAADVLYHLTVLLATRGLTLADAERVLAARRGAPRRFKPEEHP